MKRNEQLFAQSTTSDYFFVSEGTHVEITDVDTISGIYTFYVKWQQGGRIYNKFLSTENIRYIVRAHENWLGIKSHSYMEWQCTLGEALIKEEQMKKVGI